MKAKIHPKYYQNAKVTCACGNTFTTGSTLPEIQVDICSACHPFYTGEMKLVDTQGRIEKFQARKLKAKKDTKRKKRDKNTKDHRPSTLKEMLQKKPSQSKPKKT